MSSIPPLQTDPILEARRHWVEHGWADAADGMAAVTSIMRTQQIMLARIDTVLKPLSLTFARYELLALLSFTRSKALPMAKASARLQVHPTSVTNTVDRLEAAGLVRRVAHPTDGRATLIELTPLGQTSVLAATDELNARVFTQPGLGAGEVQNLISVLTGFRRDAGDFVDPDVDGHLRD
ncbi:MarR family transcriptional regulator [Cryobacterium sp. PH31-L1]|uniref:MarR family winged helix-turn-helix transcriptional regulator n=1 Tax=Cryobacterium sp. PH31-L1 TaxID=3046199 RepID=UPI0024B94431|nr:MarR family transcriptional regulator [Cryobacterium sp. PH31-L1]MDJ0378279.1 MarR family transcriptional regulator [Cryobacterium sp. PH31-L1]